VFLLSEESEEDLSRFCETLSQSQGELLRRQVEQVCTDPGGKREPTHRLTRPFHPGGKLSILPKDQKAFEFVTNHCRALFLIDNKARVLTFVAIKGKRFMSMAECPWHKGK
jgi:hypothetical protein